MGESGVPALKAGQASWQRPHSVQASPSSNCFHVKSLSLLAKIGSPSAVSAVGANAPIGRSSLEKKVFSGPVSVCSKVPVGRVMSVSATVSRWKVQMPKCQLVSAVSDAPIASQSCASSHPAGDQAAQSGRSAANLRDSVVNPVRTMMTISDNVQVNPESSVKRSGFWT